MNTFVKFLGVLLLGMVPVFVVVGCGGSGGGNGGDDGGDGIVTPAGAAEIIFLHHSTGKIIWDGGVQAWFLQNTQYSIVEQWFPANVDGNYPYDYWNIWVNQAGTGDPTLETLTAQYRMIIFKHCFPVSLIEPDIGSIEIASDAKRLENYYAQYDALKARLHEFPNTIFLVWTGAVQIQGTISEESAQRMRTFVDWVKNTWDEAGDNIYIFDFYALETEGGFYLRNEYAADEGHPTDAFGQMVAPWFSQRIVNVFEGRGDSTSLTGQ